MKAFLLRSHQHVDLLIAAVFLVLWTLGEVGRHPLIPGSLSSSASWWAALTLVAAAIALCRSLPVVAMAMVVAMLVGQLLYPQAVFSQPGQAVYLGLLLVIAGVTSAVRPRLFVLSGVFAAFVGVAVWGLLSAYGWPDSERAPLFAWSILLCAAAWGTGALLRAALAKVRTDRELVRVAKALQVAEAEALVTSERERIAQDVHDIMAHSLSVILAQADGARLLAEERPAAVAPSLGTIADTARSSLTEVRMLIETLVGSPTGIEHPGLGDLDDLVRRLSDSGLSVSVERFGGDGDLTPAQQLAVYRIVQEALTNALNHAGPGAAARLALDMREDGLALSVASRPADPSRTPAEPNTAGRGLVGMRERARLAGGWLDAGPDDDIPGGYLVTAYLPAAGRAAVTA